jgi:heme/copper-type cytochrome/quinol oxidase subunit 4
VGRIRILFTPLPADWYSIATSFLYEARAAEVCPRKGKSGMVDQQQANESISFHSQLKVLLIGICISIVLVCIAIPFFPLIDKTAPPLTLKQQVILPFFAVLLGVLACFIFLSRPEVGDYHIDPEGIQQKTLLMKPRYLRWQDVERVKWDKDLACFEGKGISISILWTLVSGKDVSQAKPFLEKVLSPDFDLSIKPVGRWSKSFVAFYLLGAALMIAIFFTAPRVWFLSGGWVAGWVSIVCVLFACFVFLHLRLKKEARKKEQINPTWRLRRREDHSS